MKVSFAWAPAFAAILGDDVLLRRYPVHMLACRAQGPVRGHLGATHQCTLAITSR
jgi:hypothetical protein